ncbi:hypothetical protein AJ79_08388 [Helicocarpus griseus UAMH5409]|uniref:Uncharacterized protein n=1 Tax=Helicocarpus griseus UAMH5409 TaxID=1447875 RepID=A0A2B7WTM2_9EURO|nr:hypothetical protein AJ79_08388 [Helicocarpus griseus UAMH5409]
MDSMTLKDACERYNAVLGKSFWDRFLDKCLGKGLADRLHIARLEKAQESSAKIWKETMGEATGSAPSNNEGLLSSNEPLRSRRDSTACTSVDDEWDRLFTALEGNVSLNGKPSNDEADEASTGSSYQMAGVGRYRHAKDAPKDLVEEGILKNLSFIGPSAKLNVDKLADFSGRHRLYENPDNDRLLEDEPNERNGFVERNGDVNHAKGFRDSSRVRSILSDQIYVYRATGVMPPRLYPEEDEKKEEVQPCVPGPSGLQQSTRPVFFVDGDEETDGCAVESCDPLSAKGSHHQGEFEPTDPNPSGPQETVSEGKGKEVDSPYHSKQNDNVEDRQPRSVSEIIQQHTPFKFDPKKRIRIKPWMTHWHIQLIQRAAMLRDQYPASERVRRMYDEAARHQAWKEKIDRANYLSRPRHGCRTIKKVVDKEKTTVTNLESDHSRQQSTDTADSSTLQLLYSETNPFDQLVRRSGLRPASTVLFPTLNPLVPYTVLPQQKEETRNIIVRNLTILQSPLDGKSPMPRASTFRQQGKNLQDIHLKICHKEILGFSALTSCHPCLTSNDWAEYYKRRDEEDELRNQGDESCDVSTILRKEQERQKRKTRPGPPLYVNYINYEKYDQPWPHILPTATDLLDELDPLMRFKLMELNAERGRTNDPMRIQGAENILDLDYYVALRAIALLREIYEERFVTLENWTPPEDMRFNKREELKEDGDAKDAKNAKET